MVIGLTTIKDFINMTIEVSFCDNCIFFLKIASSTDNIILEMVFLVVINTTLWDIN